MHLNFPTSTSLLRITIWNLMFLWAVTCAGLKWWSQGVTYGILPYKDVDQIL